VYVRFAVAKLLNAARDNNTQHEAGSKRYGAWREGGGSDREGQRHSHVGAFKSQLLRFVTIVVVVVVFVVIVVVFFVVVLVVVIVVRVVIVVEMQENQFRSPFAVGNLHNKVVWRNLHVNVINSTVGRGARGVYVTLPRSAIRVETNVCAAPLRQSTYVICTYVGIYVCVYLHFSVWCVCVCVCFVRLFSFHIRFFTLELVK